MRLTIRVTLAAALLGGLPSVAGAQAQFAALSAPSTTFTASIRPILERS